MSGLSNIRAFHLRCLYLEWQQRVDTCGIVSPRSLELQPRQVFKRFHVWRPTPSHFAGCLWTAFCRSPSNPKHDRPARA